MKILYFFNINLTREVFDDSMFNKTNPYNDEIEISVEYDFNELINKVQASTHPYEGFLSEFFSEMKLNDFGSNLDPTNEIVDKIKKYVEKYTINNKCTLALKYNKEDNPYTGMWRNMTLEPSFRLDFQSSFWSLEILIFIIGS